MGVTHEAVCDHASCCCYCNCCTVVSAVESRNDRVIRLETLLLRWMLWMLSKA